MRLTPELLASAYDFLRHTEPFVRWNMPEPEDIAFEILKGKSRYGDCYELAGRTRIRLSERLHRRYSGVLATMAHEMLHVHMDSLACVSKYRSLRTDNSAHGPGFKKLAAEVCKHHVEFDPVTF